MSCRPFQYGGAVVIPIRGGLHCACAQNNVQFNFRVWTELNGRFVFLKQREKTTGDICVWEMFRVV